MDTVFCIHKNEFLPWNGDSKTKSYTALFLDPWLAMIIASAGICTGKKWKQRMWCRLWMERGALCIDIELEVSFANLQRLGYLSLQCYLASKQTLAISSITEHVKSVVIWPQMFLNVLSPSSSFCQLLFTSCWIFLSSFDFFHMHTPSNYGKIRHDKNQTHVGTLDYHHHVQLRVCESHSNLFG